MGRQDLGFVEKHVEKVAVGVGGLLAVLGIAMTVTWAGADGIKPNEIANDANQKLAALQSKDPIGTDSSADPPVIVWANGVTRDPPKAPVALAAAVAIAPVTRVGELPKPSTGGKGPIITEPEPYGKLTPPAKPGAPVVHIARGRFGAWKPPVAPADGSLGAASGGFEPPSEVQGAVFLNFNFDQSSTLDSWWTIYEHLLAWAEYERVRLAVSTADIAAANEKFLTLWNVLNFGSEVQMQVYDPVKGWPKDWQTVTATYGSSAKFAKLLRATKIPAKGEREKDPASQAAADNAKDALVTMFLDVRSQILWPTPPGPEAGKDAVLEIYTADGRLPSDTKLRNRWPARPATNLKVVEKVDQPGEKPLKGFDDVFGTKKPAAPEVVEKKPTKAEDNGQLNRALSLKAKLTTTPAQLPMSAIIQDPNLIQPGRTCRFRVRVLVKNPVFEWDRAAGALENRVYLESDWSEPSGPVTVPEISEVFVAAASFGDPRPNVQLWRWTDGSWYSTRAIPTGLGAALRAEGIRDVQSRARDDKPFPIANVKDSAEVNRVIALFDPDATLVDFTNERVMLREALKAGTVAFKDHHVQVLRIVYQDRHGVLHTRYQIYDRSDVMRWKQDNVR